MKLLAVFTLYLAVASANPVSLADNRASNEVGEFDSLAQHHQGYNETGDPDTLVDDQDYGEVDEVDDFADYEDYEEAGEFESLAHHQGYGDASEADDFADEQAYDEADGAYGYEENDGYNDIDGYDEFNGNDEVNEYDEIDLDDYDEVNGYEEVDEVDNFTDDQDYNEVDEFDDLSDHQAYNETRELDDSVAGHHSSNEVREIAVRANDKAFDAAQKAAGGVRLRSGKSYYFTSCLKWKQKPTAVNFTREGGEGSEWVYNETKGWQNNPNGCSHTGLVIGKVRTLGGKQEGCLTCTGSPGKSFEGRMFDVKIAINDGDKWHQRVRDKWDPRENQTLFFRGEVGRLGKSETLDMKRLYRSLESAGKQWMRDASLLDSRGRIGRAVFNRKYNCLEYYRMLAARVYAATDNSNNQIAARAETQTAIPAPENIKLRDNFVKAQQAASINGTTLRHDKHYVFMFCKKRGPEPREEETESSLWVKEETIRPNSPFGCGHVGLVVGKVEKVGKQNPGCFGCLDHEMQFQANFYDVMLDTKWVHVIINKVREAKKFTRWSQRNEHEWTAEYLRDETALHFYGEVGPEAARNISATAERALAGAGADWMIEASRPGRDRNARGTAILNREYNCLTYFRSILPYFQPVVRRRIM